MNVGQALGIAVTCSGLAVGLYFGDHHYTAYAFGAVAATFLLTAAWIHYQQLKASVPSSLPVLDLVVRSTQRPYVQEIEQGDELGAISTRWYRVGVLADRLVTGVRVLLDSCVPISENVFPAHALRVMGQPGNTEFVDVHAAKEPAVFIDVFTQTWNERAAPEAQQTLHLGYVRQGRTLIPNQRQRLGLRVEGGGTSTVRYFVIDFDANGVARFTPD
jgi:hypothetical protein